MEEEKQGWDKIAEQESRRRRIGKAKKVGGGFAFGMEVVFAIFYSE